MNGERLRALRYTLPVLCGYLFLGTAFGATLAQAGYGPAWALLMSTLIYAGSMQFVTVGLLAGPFAPLSAMLVAFTVNARHLFYGISMLGRFEKRGPMKPYLVFGLTDETYSLLCAGEAPDGVDKGWYDFFLTLLDQLYWIAGSLFGNLAGAALPFDSTGIDFAMTALFLVIFVEQWENAVTHLPALIGLGASVLCLLLFGADRFIPFAMVVILRYILSHNFSRLLSMQSKRLIPSVMVRTSRFSFSIISLVSITSPIFIMIYSFLLHDTFLDSVHFLKNFLALAFDCYTNLLTKLVHLV